MGLCNTFVFLRCAYQVKKREKFFFHQSTFIVLLSKGIENSVFSMLMSCDICESGQILIFY